MPADATSASRRAHDAASVGAARSATLRIMTYNVHSCLGTDGRYDPARIADVIAHEEPDIVALQEVDMGVERSAGLQQADWLAARLDMTAHFTCATPWGQGRYGNALLCRHPFRLLSEGCLPSRGGETRAAQWLRVSWAGLAVDVINTHLSVHFMERLAQVSTLLGTEWLSRPTEQALVVCGDFNSGPFSPVYRRLARRLHDAPASAAGGACSTWPSVLPFMRLDHVFTSDFFAPARVRVPRSELTRLASDHLPLVVDLSIKTEPELGGA